MVIGVAEKFPLPLFPIDGLLLLVAISTWMELMYSNICFALRFISDIDILADGYLILAGGEASRADVESFSMIEELEIELLAGLCSPGCGVDVLDRGLEFCPRRLPVEFVRRAPPLPPRFSTRAGFVLGPTSFSLCCLLFREFVLFGFFPPLGRLVSTSTSMASSDKTEHVS